MVKKLFIIAGVVIICGIVFFVGFRIGHLGETSDYTDEIAVLEGALSEARAGLEQQRELLHDLKQKLSEADTTIDQLESGIGRLEEESLQQQSIINSLRESDQRIRESNTDLGRSIEDALAGIGELIEEVKEDEDL